MKLGFNNFRVAAFAVILFIFTGSVCFAEERGASEELSADDLKNMLIVDEVKVKGKVSQDSVEGKSVISEDVIDMLPKGNGDITEALRIVPGVQFDDEYGSSFTGGEIKPARVSISGGKDYQNLFLIDGMVNSSYMSPAEDNVYKVGNVEGHPQKFFLDSSVVKEVTVYDSNIPVKYSGFIGGVVDVETKSPSRKLWGSISYRTTRSSWSTFYIDRLKKEEFENSNNSSEYQPQFEKHYFNTVLNTPVGKKSSVMLGYKYLDSTIPVRFYNKWQKETRESHSFYVKGLHNLDGSSYLEGSFTYSPYKEVRYYPNVKDSRFDVEGGGYYTILKYVKENGEQKTEIQGDYSRSFNNRKANNTFYHWAATGSKDWGFAGEDTDVYAEDNISMETGSNEGGYGDLNKAEETLNLKIEQTSASFEFAGKHKLFYGASYSLLGAEMEQPDAVYDYQVAKEDKDVRCGESEGIDCIEGEQYFQQLDYKPAYKNDVQINQLNLYAQDSYSFWRLMFRMGLRYEYNDYMENHDLSPRTHLEYDVFDNKRTVIITGYNKYYGSNILDHKLRSQQPNEVEYIRNTYQNEVEDWTLVTANEDTLYKYSELRTPYSDEYVLGVAQYLLGGTANVKYITRKNKDEFAKEKVIGTNGQRDYYTMNNNGSSSFQSVQFKWDRSWKDHNVLFNVMWQESKTAQVNYDDEIDLEDLEEQVIYDGEVITLADLPKNNFNRPIIANLTYTGKYFKRLKISPMIKYRASYQKIVKTATSITIKNTGEIDPQTGEPETITASMYEKKQFEPSILVDLRLEYEETFFKRHKVIFTLDINNFLNRKIVNGYGYYGNDSYKTYEMGRNFWAGVKYEF